MRKTCLLAWLICLALCFAPVSVFARSTGELTVSAAISLRDAFSEIGRNFQARQKGLQVLFNFGASGNLARQIEAGASVDVFASAGEPDMDTLGRKALLVHGSRADFAVNGMVLVKPASSLLPIRSLADLRKAEVKKVAIGNPQTVPAGRYAKEWLAFARLWPAIQDKLVFAENARQVLDYIARNEVDAGLVYATDAATSSGEVITVMTAPAVSHQPIVYPIAIIQGTKAKETAERFIEFVLSGRGQGILRKYKFQPSRLLKK